MKKSANTFGKLQDAVRQELNVDNSTLLSRIYHCYDQFLASISTEIIYETGRCNKNVIENIGILQEITGVPLTEERVEDTYRRLWRKEGYSTLADLVRTTTIPFTIIEEEFAQKITSLFDEKGTDYSTIYDILEMTKKPLPKKIQSLVKKRYRAVARRDLKQDYNEFLELVRATRFKPGEHIMISLYKRFLPPEGIVPILRNREIIYVPKETLTLKDDIYIPLEELRKLGSETGVQPPQELVDRVYCLQMLCAIRTFLSDDIDSLVGKIEKLEYLKEAGMCPSVSTAQKLYIMASSECFTSQTNYWQRVLSIIEEIIGVAPTTTTMQDMYVNILKSFNEERYNDKERRIGCESFWSVICFLEKRTKNPLLKKTVQRVYKECFREGSMKKMEIIRACTNIPPSIPEREVQQRYAQYFATLNPYLAKKVIIKIDNALQEGEEEKEPITLIDNILLLHRATGRNPKIRAIFSSKEEYIAGTLECILHNEIYSYSNTKEEDLYYVKKLLREYGERIGALLKTKNPWLFIENIIDETKKEGRLAVLKEFLTSQGADDYQSIDVFYRILSETQL